MTLKSYELSDPKFEQLRLERAQRLQLPETTPLNLILDYERLERKRSVFIEIYSLAPDASLEDIRSAIRQDELRFKKGMYEGTENYGPLKKST